MGMPVLRGKHDSLGLYPALWTNTPLAPSMWHCSHHWDAVVGTHELQGLDN